MGLGGRAQPFPRNIGSSVAAVRAVPRLHQQLLGVPMQPIKPRSGNFFGMGCVECASAKTRDVQYGKITDSERKCRDGSWADFLVEGANALNRKAILMHCSTESHKKAVLGLRTEGCHLPAQVDVLAKSFHGLTVGTSAGQVPHADRFVQVFASLQKSAKNTYIVKSKSMNADLTSPLPSEGVNRDQHADACSATKMLVCGRARMFSGAAENVIGLFSDSTTMGDGCCCFVLESAQLRAFITR